MKSRKYDGFAPERPLFIRTLLLACAFSIASKLERTLDELFILMQCH
jgi:hypothetical protein